MSFLKPNTSGALLWPLLLLAISSIGVAARRNQSVLHRQFDNATSLLPALSPDYALTLEKCPPCFNCMLPAFSCGQYGQCNKFNGQCECPPGWSGIDCLTPQCDSLSDGDHRRPRKEGESCQCKDGWGGVNCNVCKNDDACVGFPIPEASSLLDDDNGGNMTCYKGGETVFSNHQMCNVTNRKILDMLPDRPPQVTFSCNRQDATCSFQFWTAEVESFYCALDGCFSATQPGYDTNTTTYACDKIKCSCVTGRFLCGESGSIDIGDFLKEEIRGPAQFSCKTGSGCKFEEPAMNELIDSVFGDSYITLQCEGGECLHYSRVPGYVRPPKPRNSRWLAISSSGAIVIVLLSSAVLWYAGRVGKGDDFGKIRLPEAEAAKLMSDHVPASLYFSGVSYSLGGRSIIDNISGNVKSGQVMAIMGASGAGKSTFLDILARKNKRGAVTGSMLVNGREVKNSEFKKVAGFVDQEDTLMSTLTVYETVLYSALLRLPRDMSFEAKKFRTLETLNELGILEIRDSRIGDTGARSISGGEKRRVSIACELVTSPSILFLDEPTSGLDSFNAFNVVECLVSLARDYNRTVVFTIHQPRSNIVALFDQLLVLGAGKLVYSGAYLKCPEYFASIGYPCPTGFNIADYLIDLTMQANMEHRNHGNGQSSMPDSSPGTSQAGDEEQGLPLVPQSVPISVRSITSASGIPEDTDETVVSSTGKYLRKKTSQIFNAVSSYASNRVVDAPITPKLASLVQSYADSMIASDIKAEGEEAMRQASQAAAHVTASRQLPDVAEETSLLRGRKRASWGTQFRILSGRAFKNLYRDPALLAAHYLSSIALAVICGLFYHNITNDIAGFQNRLGLFFFTLALFGFSCLSSLGLFANERILFMRERSNGYYSTFTYFSSKILFDILPLRLVPPLMFGGIVYGLVGLVPTVAGFWKFLLALVLFNLTTASVVLLLSIVFDSLGVASLVGTLVMLFNLMFTGLLINRDTVPAAFKWLHTISFFHAAFESLAVNELRYLQLKEVKYGVELDVPAATILSTFGLRAQSYWWPNISLLGIFFAVFTVASFMYLHFFVKERR